MSADESKPAVPLWAHRQPPAGLSEEWQRTYRTLVDPITIIRSFRPDKARRGTRELFAAWHDTLRSSEEGVDKILPSLHGRSQNTWRAGQRIKAAISQISASLCSLVRFLAHPTPTRNGPEATADALRADLADQLSRFDAAPLQDELAAVVVADQRDDAEVVLTVEDVTILYILSQSGRALLFSQIPQQAAQEIRKLGGPRQAGLVTLSETKLRERVPILEAEGLVSRPLGANGRPTQRKGIGITEKGRRRLENASRVVR